MKNAFKRAYKEDHKIIGSVNNVLKVSLFRAPTNLTATVQNVNEILLDWTDNSSNEDGFKIEQSTDNVNFVEIATVGADVTVYLVENLDENTTYYYKVRAFKN